MQLFGATLNQMAFLFSLIFIGFILVRSKILTKDAAAVLSKLENNVFIPALVIGTFMKNFTVEKLSSAGFLVLFACAALVIAVPVGIMLAHFLAKDAYMRRIYTYGLVFANFGFMGNAVVQAIYPEIFMEYLLFTLPSWALIYVWAVPVLLMADDGAQQTAADRLRAVINPMFIGIFIGIILGMSGIAQTAVWQSGFLWLEKVIGVCGDCMSPVAMLLTGITVGAIDLKKTFRNGGIYIASLLRLIVIPACVLAFFALVRIPDRTAVICTVCLVSMPLGLNTVVVPSAYGRDTSAAAGMALVSHLLSCLTLPVVFMLLERIVE